MVLRDDYHGSWPARQHRDPGQDDSLFGIVRQVRSVAEEHGIEDAYEQITLMANDETHTVASLEAMDRSFYDGIEDVELSYTLVDDQELELAYSRSIFDDALDCRVRGDVSLREEIEDATGNLLYGTGLDRLTDIGRSWWRDLD